MWYWKPRMKSEKPRKGLRCRILARGKRNSIAIELEDGEIVITSRYAVRQSV